MALTEGVLFQASRGKWLDAKDRRQAARVSVLQGKLSQAQGAASLREENLLQELKRAKEEKEKEANLLRQEAKKKEEELLGKLSRLSEEYEKLKSSMVSTVCFRLELFFKRRFTHRFDRVFQVILSEFHQYVYNHEE